MNIRQSGLSIIVVIMVGLVFSGCSPAEIFQQLSGTTIDQAAGEKIEQSEAMLKKLERIEAKKQSFSEHAQMGTVEPGIEMAAIAFRNDYSLDNKSVVEIEAILPTATNKFYEGWLAKEGSDPISLGALEYLNLEDYFLSFESTEDLSQYDEVFITDEATADLIPETRVLIGEFGQ